MPKPVPFPSAAPGLSSFLLNPDTREQQRHVFYPALPEIRTLSHWGVFLALRTSWEWWGMGGKAAVPAAGSSCAQWPLSQDPGGPCRAPYIAGGSFQTHFSSCSQVPLTLHLPYHPPIIPLGCCRLSHLLWLQVMVQEPHNREASQVPAQSKGNHTAFGSSRNLSKRADQHLRCYTVSGPQGGQFFKLRTPQAMKINSSHDLSSIKGS